MYSTQKDLESINNEIANVYRDTFLNTISDVQSKFEDIMKKQRQERLDAIEKEKNAEIDKINAIKSEYDKSNSESDFNKQLSEEQDKLASIQRQITSAQLSQDSAGKSRLADLLKQQTDQQKTIDDMVLQRQRDLNSESLDAQSKAIEDQAKAQTDTLNEKYSDENIQTMVGKALETNNGLIEDINGNLVSMKDLYLDWAEKFGEGLGILGDKLESEFLDKLTQAQYYMTQMGSVYSSLGITSFGDLQIDTGSFNNSNVLSAVDLSTILPTYSLANNLPAITTPTVNTSSNTSSQSVVIQNLMNIESLSGSLDDTVLSQLQKIVSDAITQLKESFNGELSILGYS